VFVARPVVWPPYGQGREYGWSPSDHLVGNAYLLAALALSVWAAVALNRIGSVGRRSDTESAGSQTQTSELDGRLPGPGVSQD
jgi:alpha-1,2-mannosyltransferase